MKFLQLVKFMFIVTGIIDISVSITPPHKERSTLEKVLNPVTEEIYNESAFEGKSKEISSLRTSAVKSINFEESNPESIIDVTNNNNEDYLPMNLNSNNSSADIGIANRKSEDDGLIGEETKTSVHCTKCSQHVTKKFSSKFIQCMCGLFTSQHPHENERPGISRTFHHVCHDQVSSEETCMKFCLSFALSLYETRDNVICSHAVNAKDLILYLHSKMGEDNYIWNFTGLSLPSPICCRGGKRVKC